MSAGTSSLALIRHVRPPQVQTIEHFHHVERHLQTFVLVLVRVLVLERVADDVEERVMLLVFVREGVGDLELLHLGSLEQVTMPGGS